MARRGEGGLALNAIVCKILGFLSFLGQFQHFGRKRWYFWDSTAKSKVFNEKYLICLVNQRFSAKRIGFA